MTLQARRRNVKSAPSVDGNSASGNDSGSGSNSNSNSNSNSGSNSGVDVGIGVAICNEEDKGMKNNNDANNLYSFVYDDDNDDDTYNSACSFCQFVMNPCKFILSNIPTSSHKRDNCFLCCHKNSGPFLRRYHYYRTQDMVQKVGSFLQSATRQNRQYKVLLLLLSAIFIMIGPIHQKRILLSSTTLLLKHFDHSNNIIRDDVGGWTYNSGRNEQFFFHYKILEEQLSESTTHTTVQLPDYGGLIFESLAGNTKNNFRRKIKDQYDNQLLHYEKEKLIYNLTKKYEIRKLYWYYEDYEAHASEYEGKVDTKYCHRANWTKLHFPTCNAVHEIDLSKRPFDLSLAKRNGDVQSTDSNYVAHGAFRDVWRLTNQLDDAVSYDINSHIHIDIGNGNENDNKVKNSYNNDEAVLKIARYERPLDYHDYYYARNDAQVMERLSSSKYIVDMYGYCGFSVLVESLDDALENNIVPGSGYVTNPKAVAKLRSVKTEVKSKNKFTPQEKLYIAYNMAKSIEALHGYPYGAIVHDDIQLCQWMEKTKRSKNKNQKYPASTGEGGVFSRHFKLGDFNRARVLEYDLKKQQYCKYENGRAFGNYRSPEEYAEGKLDEKIDIYSFGNNIYALVTGLWVYYDNEKDEIIPDLMKARKRPYIDPRYRTGNKIEKQLIEIMERCWEYDSDDRIDIFEVVRLLEQIKREMNNKQKEPK